MLHLVNDIIDLSKISSGNLELEVEPFHLRRAMEGVVNALAIKAHEQQTELAYILPLDVPHLLRGDCLRLRQILLNLLGNAVKFTTKGSILLKAELVESIDNRVTLQFCVQDTGIGIRKEKQKTIFQQYCQAESSTSRLYGGSGLGLNISQRLVQAMGGRIWVESEKSRGCSFYFTVRLHLGESGRTDTLYCRNMTMPRVLVVDRVEASRQATTSLLELWNIDSTHTPCLNNAIQKLSYAAEMGQPYEICIVNSSILENIQENVEKLFQYHGMKNSQLLILTAVGEQEYDPEHYSMNLKNKIHFLEKPLTENEFADFLQLLTGETEAFQSRSKTPFYEGDCCDFMHRFNVLVVDDSIGNRELTRILLEQEGHTVFLANNGKYALNILMTEENIDAVFMDVQMPVMDGITATRKIRGLKSRIKDIPVIAMTGGHTEQEKQTCYNAGMNEYLGKPIESGLLFAALERCCVIEK